MNQKKLLSKRMDNLPFSSIRKIFEQANVMEKSGERISHMEIGRPDFDTPENIKNATYSALKSGQVHYSSNSGVLELRDAISKKLLHDNQIKVNPETEVVVTIGCKEAVFDSFLAFLNPEDEVIIPEPAWLEYKNTVKFLGGTPVSISLRSENNFILDPEEVSSKITENTKMLVLCSPHNPTGSVLDLDTLKRLAEICIQHNLIVISDEIYEKIIYDDAEHISIGSIPGMEGRTITINGFSKAYAMDGWRLGYAAGSESLIRPILKVHQYNTTCANTFAQYGAIEAYNGSQEKVKEMVNEFDKRRQYLVKELNNIPGVSCVMPKGSFYTFPSFKKFQKTSQEMATYLLKEAHIACVPGSAFGENGEGYIRMAYSTDMESIKLGIDKMKRALSKI